MNRLPLEKRKQFISLLVEGMSMRSVSRVADLSITSSTLPERKYLIPLEADIKAQTKKRAW